MKLIFSHESSVIAGNIKNILDLERIEVVLKNEFASGGVGDLSAFDAWVEVWLVNDKDEDKALSIIEEATNSAQKPSWFCKHCKEENAGSFELCWQCQQPLENEYNEF